MLKFLNIFYVENRDLSYSQDHLRVGIQFHPIKTAVLGIWVYLKDHTFIPAFVISKFGIKIDLNLVANLDRFGHGLFFST
jgi:hypothetical protein